MLSKQVKEYLKNWLDNMQDGDVIKVIDGHVYLYNECGCELDSSYGNVDSEYICPNCGTVIGECRKGYCEGCHSEYFGA